MRLGGGRCALAAFRYALLSGLCSTDSFVPLADARPKQKQSRAAVAWGAAAPGLNWRTLHRAVRTEHATMAGHGLKTNAAAGTIPKEQACIGRHNFTGLFAAMRASEH